MLIIGEKINGTRPQVARAILERDAEAIQSLAACQVTAGADWLDINAGTPPDREPYDLVWLVNTVQVVVDVPLCLDSTNPQALEAAVSVTKQTPVINSISGEPERLARLLPLVADHGCPVIALTLDKRGIPTSAAARVAVAGRILEKTRGAGIPDERVYLDPLTLTLAADSTSGRTVLESLAALRQAFPNVKLCLGLSNLSYGLPGRSYLNRIFLTLVLSQGLDAAILDPMDRQLRITLFGIRAVLGQDKFGVEYIRFLRSIRNRNDTTAAAENRTH